MKRCLATVVLLVLCLAPLRADLTLTQTMTIEGPMAAMMADKPMTMVMRVKGKRARADMDMMQIKISSLTDLMTKEITILNHQDKTAQLISPASPLAGTVPVADIDVSFKPTGQSKMIDGVQCHEHAFHTAFAFAQVSGGQMPKEALEMLKDVKMIMDGSVWIAKSAPGAAEYIAFQKAAVEANLAGALASMMGGQQSGGMDKLMAAMSEAPGLPYLTEMTMSVEGTGQMVEMMKQQMTGMKLIQKTTSVSTEAISDDLFTVPAEYTKK